MKSPLTEKELRVFEQYLITRFRSEYEKVLSCGAFDDIEYGDLHDHRMAKIAAICSIDKIWPLEKNFKSALRNYRNF